MRLQLFMLEKYLKQAGSNGICWLVILINCVLKKDEITIIRI